MSAITWAIGGVVVAGLGAATWRAPRLTSALLWSLVSAVLVSAALILVVPGAFRDKVFWFAMLLPFVWVAMQFWLYWDKHRWRVTLALFGLATVSAAIVFLSPSPV
ncbi:MAG: hypothetical protein AAF267_01980 [Deinococcota bacterium]